jgi:hypothetical protein
VRFQPLSDNVLIAEPAIRISANRKLPVPPEALFLRNDPLAELLQVNSGIHVASRESGKLR